MARLNYIKSFRGTTKTEDGNLKCSSCGDAITPGDSYRWWANRAPGMRGGFRRVRCMKGSCTPTMAEMTPGRRGQLMSMQDDWSKQQTETEAFTETNEFEEVASTIASDIESFADEIEESGQNMEDGFEHPTEQSEALKDCAEEIRGHAEELESMDFDDPPGEEEGKSEAEENEEEYDHEGAMNSWREEQWQKIEDEFNEVDLTY